MIPVWWSIILTAVGALGLFLAGRHSKWGWAVGIAAQGLWIAYAVATQQWGFLGSAGIYGTVYILNFVKWHNKQKEDDHGQIHTTRTQVHRRGE